jgi:hypothetical protein
VDSVFCPPARETGLQLLFTGAVCKASRLTLFDRRSRCLAPKSRAANRPTNPKVAEICQNLLTDLFPLTTLSPSQNISFNPSIGSFSCPRSGRIFRRGGYGNSLLGPSRLHNHRLLPRVSLLPLFQSGAKLIRIPRVPLRSRRPRRRVVLVLAPKPKNELLVWSHKRAPHWSGRSQWPTASGGELLAAPGPGNPWTRAETAAANGAIEAPPIPRSCSQGLSTGSSSRTSLATILPRFRMKTGWPVEWTSSIKAGHFATVGAARPEKPFLILSTGKNRPPLSPLTITRQNAQRNLIQTCRAIHSQYESTAILSRFVD